MKDLATFAAAMSPGDVVRIQGVAGSLMAVVASVVYEESGKPVLVVASGPATMA